MRLFLALIMLLVAASSRAAVTFDGTGGQIELDDWQVLSGEVLPDKEALAAGLDEYPWHPLTDALRAAGLERAILRLDIHVTYGGSQSPLLVITDIATYGFTLGLLEGGTWRMWRPVNEASEAALDSMHGHTGGLIQLPIDAPGDYQLLVFVDRVGEADIVYEASLHLRDDYILRAYPTRIAVATWSMGMLSVSLLVCVVLMIFYRYRADLIYASLFLIGALSLLLIREGVLHLVWQIGALWWSVHLLFLTFGLTFGGVLLFISVDFQGAAWRRARIALQICGWGFVMLGLFNVLLPIRPYKPLLLLGALFQSGGMALALSLLFLRALKSGWRDRLFALVMGGYCAIVLYQFLSNMFTSRYVPWLPTYVANNLLALYIVGQYLILMARDYSREQSLKSADMARVDLVNRLSHEIRTPLNAVIGLADLLKGASNQRKIDSYAQMIQTAGDTLLGLVNDILDFTKLGTRGIPLARHRLRIDKEISEVLTGFIPRFIESGILRLNLSIDPRIDFYVLGDEVRIKQIFSNLISNAIKFSPAEGIIDISLQPGQRRDGRVELRCSIVDHGRGIPAEKLSTVFEPYTQMEAEDSGQLRGTGLGLAICRHLIEEMGGQISVKSVVGRGTTFSFNLWLELDPQAPDLFDLFAPLRGRRVLIVSEHSHFARIETFLANFGAETRLVPTPPAAEEQPYDLIVFDIQQGLVDNDVDWLNSQPATTAVELVELKDNNWSQRITHPNTRTRVVITPLLTLLAQFVEHLTGTAVDVLDDRPVNGGAPSLHGHSVLLIDDNVINLTVASKLLESLDVHCETAESGAEGLARLSASRHFSLVLLDCEMPGMNGFEVCQRWRAIEAARQWPRTPVVALTAHALNDVRNACFAAGMDDVIYKPIGRSAMIAVLSQFPVPGPVSPAKQAAHGQL